MSSPKEIFNKHAAAYQERFMNLDLYDDTYNSLCDLLKENARVLEIGCGPGNITRYLLSKRTDLKILGIDIAENMIALAKQNCPAADFRVMDCRNISSIGQTFDAVVCGFCAPYLNKDEINKLISDSTELLTHQGVIYLSAIEGDHANSGYQKSSNGEDECMIYYYSENNLRQILEEKKFGKFLLFRKEYGASMHLVTIASKQ